MLPVYARDDLGGASGLAAAVTVYGVGGLLGTATYGVAGRRLPRRLLFVTVWTIYPVLSFGLVGRPSLPLAMALLVLIGFVTGAYDPFEVTMHQELSAAREMRARVFGLLIAVESVAMPLGMLAYGVVIEQLGLTTALLAFAIGNTALGAYAVINRSGRRLPVAQPT